MAGKITDFPSTLTYCVTEYPFSVFAGSARQLWILLRMREQSESGSQLAMSG
jgi:hypothetical protein